MSILQKKNSIEIRLFIRVCVIERIVARKGKKKTFTIIFSAIGEYYASETGRD